MMVLVLATRLAHRVRTETGERLHIILPFGFARGVPSVLHGRVGRASDRLVPESSYLPRAREHVSTVAIAAAYAHVLMLVHHRGMTA